MCTINLRLILVSAGLVGIIAVGANLLHGIQVRRSATILLELGTQKIKDGRPDQALGFLTNYTILCATQRRGPNPARRYAGQNGASPTSDEVVRESFAAGRRPARGTS